MKRKFKIPQVMQFYNALRLTIPACVAALIATSNSSKAAEAYVWTYPSSGGIGAIYAAPALASDGTVYVSTQTGSLYAINPNGTLKWSFALGAAANSGPSVGPDGTVFVPASTKMFAVNPNGTQKWVFDTTINASPAWGDQVYSTAAVARDGTVYFGSGILVYAVTSGGVQKWQSQLNGNVLGEPVLGWDGTVYAFETGTEFVALWPETGIRKWTQYTFSGSSVPALGYNGPIYNAGRTDNGYNFRSISVAGGFNWQLLAGLDNIVSSVSLDSSGVIYGGHQGGGISAINPTGSQKWFAPYGNYSTPANSSNGRLYFGGTSGYVYGLRQSDGASMWSYSSGSAIYSSPALGTDGRLYVGTVDGRVLAFSGAGSPAASSWPQAARNQQRTGALDPLAISVGYYHNLALKRDGTVWSWGYNSNGQLGDGTTVNRATPVQVSGLTGVIAISAGQTHSLALKSDGTVWAWGIGTYGRLGDGTGLERHTPVQVSGLTGVIAISAGGYHSMALKSDGTVWACGNGYYGQLGQGVNNSDYYTPVQVPGFTGVVSISAGFLTSLAVKNNGTVWGWGQNNYYQIGDGTTTQRWSPVQTSGLTSVALASMGVYHGLALKTDGTVWAWGNNAWGQIGDGTTTTRPTAVQTTGLSSVARIYGGNYQSLAVKNDGSVLAWGNNSQGQLGDGSTTDRYTPVSVLSGAIAIGSGTYHSISLQNDLTLRGWGYNGYG
ncbi:MAG TPA: PQQ-binding-like beta-propeller repeat protein, partial [Verrucomicrobiae bacterium]|nr:PQQ-binding-like beta-propeller repeat protein [Verrucomicrobiae bacterium]